MDPELNTNSIFSRIKIQSKLIIEAFVSYDFINNGLLENSLDISNSTSKHINQTIRFCLILNNAHSDELLNLVNNIVPQFAFNQVQSESIKPDLPACSDHVFTLTDLDGFFLFGYTLTWSLANLFAEKPTHRTIVLLTHKPFHNAFTALLTHIYKMSIKTEDFNPSQTLKLFNSSYPSIEFEAINSGAKYNSLSDQYSYKLYFDTGGDKHLIAIFPKGEESNYLCDSPLDEFHHFLIVPESIVATELYKCLSVRHIVTLWKHLLNERRLVLVSTSLARVSRTALAGISLLYPMYWQHVFVSVLPAHMIETLSAPMPYLIGVQRCVFEKYLSLNNRLKLLPLNSTSPGTNMGGAKNNIASKVSSSHSSNILSTKFSLGSRSETTPSSGVDAGIIKISDPFNYAAPDNCAVVYDLDRNQIFTLQDLTIHKLPQKQQENNYQERSLENGNSTSVYNETSIDHLGSNFSNATGNFGGSNYGVANTEAGALGLPLPTYLENGIIEKLSKFQEKPTTSSSNSHTNSEHYVSGQSGGPTRTTLQNQNSNNTDTLPPPDGLIAASKTSHLQIPLGYAFFQALVDLIGHYRAGLKFEPGQLITFDSGAFIKASRASLKPCLEALVKTQIFQQFITERLYRLNGGLGFNDTFEKAINDMLHLSPNGPMPSGSMLANGSGNSLTDDHNQLQKYKAWMNVMKNEGDFYFSMFKRKTSRVLADKRDIFSSKLRSVAATKSSLFASSKFHQSAPVLTTNSSGLSALVSGTLVTNYGKFATTLDTANNDIQSDMTKNEKTERISESLTRKCSARFYTGEIDEDVYNVSEESSSLDVRFEDKSASSVKDSLSNGYENASNNELIDKIGSIKPPDFRVIHKNNLCNNLSSSDAAAFNLSTSLPLDSQIRRNYQNILSLTNGHDPYINSDVYRHSGGTYPLIENGQSDNSLPYIPPPPDSITPHTNFRAPFVNGHSSNVSYSSSNLPSNGFSTHDNGSIGCVTYAPLRRDRRRSNAGNKHDSLIDLEQEVTGPDFYSFLLDTKSCMPSTVNNECDTHPNTTLAESFVKQLELSNPIHDHQHDMKNSILNGIAESVVNSNSHVKSAVLSAHLPQLFKNPFYDMSSTFTTKQPEHTPETKKLPTLVMNGSSNITNGFVNSHVQFNGINKKGAKPLPITVRVNDGRRNTANTWEKFE